MFLLRISCCHLASVMRCLKRTRPVTQLPQSRAGGQTPYLRSLDHLGRSSESKDRKNPNKIKCDGQTDGGTDGRTDERTNGRTEERTDGRTNGQTRLCQGAIEDKILSVNMFFNNFIDIINLNILSKKNNN